MNTTMLVLLIFAIVMIARHKRERSYLDQRFSEHEQFLGSQRPDARLPDTAALEREVESLHERVRVLERIVTEANTADARETRRIAEEIEALRDR